MAQLIEIDRTKSTPEKIRINPGDILLFKATGGYIISGEGVVEVLGAFSSGHLLSSGEKVSSQGTPSTVIVCALKKGTAQINIVHGDPWNIRRDSLHELEVEP